MKFEPGKYYKQTTGEMLHTLVFAETTMWGTTLVAELSPVEGMNTLVPVGSDSDSYTANYTEVTEEEWMTRFSKE